MLPRCGLLQHEQGINAEKTSLTCSAPDETTRYSVPCIYGLREFVEEDAMIVISIMTTGD